MAYTVNGKKMEWKFDNKGRRVQKEVKSDDKAAEEEEKGKEGAPGKKGGKAGKKKSPEPAEKARIQWSCKEDAIEAFKQLLDDQDVNQDSVWKESVKTLANDERYYSMMTSGEKKNVKDPFHPF